MPVYEYKCRACGRQHEFIRKFSDSPKEECPDCGGSLEKLISSTSFVLKGSGWYATDYASGDRKKKMEAEKGESKEPKKSEKKEKPGSESKDKSESGKREKSTA